jgi:hypothetical protein
MLLLNAKYKCGAVVLALAWTAFNAPCFAQVVIDMEACGKIADKERRLDCYDTLRELTRQAEPATPAAAPVPVPLPSLNADAVKAEMPTNAAPMSSSPVSANAEQLNTPQPTQLLTQPAAPAVEKKSRKKTEPETFASPIKTAKRRADGLLVIDLENGQRWRGSFRLDATLPKIGEVATMKPGVLGSYFLTTESGVYVRMQLAE